MERIMDHRNGGDYVVYPASRAGGHGRDHLAARTDGTVLVAEAGNFARTASCTRCRISPGLRHASSG
jgi:hypothetical protein